MKENKENKENRESTEMAIMKTRHWVFGGVDDLVCRPGSLCLCVGDVCLAAGEAGP
jgi:hypothetical protein